MKRFFYFFMIVMTPFVIGSCKNKQVQNETDASEPFEYVVDQFADVEILRYQVPAWDDLSLNQKLLIYYLSEAASWGRDITFDQNYVHNLAIKEVLENIMNTYSGDRESAHFIAFTDYVKRFWFSNGIHHHYSNAKFFPEISPEDFKELMENSDISQYTVQENQTYEQYQEWMSNLIFNPDIAPMKISSDNAKDKITYSASNFYQNVTQKEVEDYYHKLEQKLWKKNPEQPIAVGLNSQLVKVDNKVQENVYHLNGLYGKAIEKIIYWLDKASSVAENEAQKNHIQKLIEYYTTGDLTTWDDYNILWVQDLASKVDYVNGFIEVYGDPLQRKGTWESIVNFKDEANTKRTEIISDNAQWFEDHSPIANNLKKKEVKGVAAKVITLAFLGGESYPTTPLGINLPNSNWIRKGYGSKSVTMSNIMFAHNQAGLRSGVNDEFYYSAEEIKRAEEYGYITYNLFVDMHECLGHGSGQLAPGVSDGSLREYHSVIEETRADLFALYFLGDQKIVDLGLVSNPEAYKAEYYRQIVNGLMMQLNRIDLGGQITQTHMRDRALIARWCLERGKDEKVIEIVVRDGKKYVKINDYEKLRGYFGELLKIVQDIKSYGKLAEAKKLVETYAIHIDPELHKEVKDRYSLLDVHPYSGFINPKFHIIKENNQVIDIELDYSQTYMEQMLEYGKKYRILF
ncbi:MAG TPA: dihydrofolate reductase [Bacteroidales bacterium]|nr:dihydrofolate reductase [Bacteroidales bacterium]HOH21725.1 dihydrofolate reductase [Bacteroidales bacterium]HPZ02864.1 dihydrofolate reductase [Bacteroidales bacterium]HQB74254.1 dihydrofolate reductase [Bacteroidales bacterium]